MKNNNELDQIVESFLQPKKSTTLGLKELFALFEEVQRINEIETPTVYPSTTNKKYEQEHESVSFFYKIYNETLATQIPEGNDPIDKIENFITFVNNLKNSKNLKNDKDQGNINISNSLAAIIFTSSLHKLIEDFIPDQPQSAGFFFERFVNLLFKAGTVTVENEINKFPIQDIEVTMNDKIYYLSLKLIKDTSITGSIGNILKFFNNKYERTYKAGNYDFSLINLDKNEEPIALTSSGNSNKNIIYVIANKTTKQNQETGQSDNVISFNMFEFNFEQFLKMLGKEKSLAYNKYLKDPNNALKAEIYNLKTKILADQEKISRIDTEIESLEDSIRRFEDSDAEEDLQVVQLNKEEIENLSYERQEIRDLLPDKLQQLVSLQDDLGKTGSSAKYLQFNIPITKLQTDSSKKKTDLILSLRAKEKNDILIENKKLFDEIIDQIIEEANTISYKVNNYLLSIDNTNVTDQEREQLAQKAYNSAANLQTNLGSKTGITPVDNKSK